MSKSQKEVDKLFDDIIDQFDEICKLEDKRKKEVDKLEALLIKMHELCSKAET